MQVFCVFKLYWLLLFLRFAKQKWNPEELGARAFNSFWKGIYHQCDVPGCKKSMLWSTAYLLNFPLRGQASMSLFVWTFHDCKADCPTFLYTLPVSFTDVQFPLVLLLPLASIFFHEIAVFSVPPIKEKSENLLVPQASF